MAKIQVILLEDVAGQGRKGEIVSVSDGYARNFLLKEKKGIIATPEELKKIANKKLKEEQKAEEDRLKAMDVKKVIEGEKIVMKVKAGDTGRLFGAITNKEVAEEIKKVFGVEIDKKKIECNIHSLGEHTATVKLHHTVKADVKVVTEAI